MRLRELDVQTFDQAPQPETDTSDNRLPPGTPDRGETDVRPKRIRRAATFTSTPDTAAPELRCPNCDRPLLYRQTVISGIRPIERWDYFDCRTCGAFVYRDRTRKLRPTP
jgi:predicted RNA-binding Zn-ribbon protein involved in translation (DUF1610 family)